MTQGPSTDLRRHDIPQDDYRAGYFAALTQMFTYLESSGVKISTKLQAWHDQVRAWFEAPRGVDDDQPPRFWLGER